MEAILSSIADRLAQKSSVRSGAVKQVRLHLVYLNVSTSLLVSLLVGVVLGVFTVIIVLTAWVILTRTGSLDQIASVIAGGAADGITVKSVLSFSQVFALSALLGLVNVVVTTIFGTVSAVLYNLVVRLTGGLFVGFTNR
ncbi:DUF3566 domain-containing protein [Frigoribacterium sp. UYMn621]|uniref:DUF3566 domain-containing protein n=1 Tax=Frigoribacterium sp. UYMn621 TaxID=3156343 RepID=UPI0033976153